MINELCTVKRPDYELENGRLIDNIPKVLSKNRLPIWTARFHEGRTKYAGQFPEWNSWSYCPGELAIYPIRKGDVLHAITCSKDGLTEAGKLLFAQFKPDVVPVDYGIDASRVYDQLMEMKPKQGIIRVTEADIAKYAGKDLARKDVSGNKLQRILFRHSSEVPKQFKENSEIMREAIKTSFAPKYETAMGIYFASPNANVPKLMAWGVDRLDDRSLAGAGCNVVIGSGRLVSVAPEALDAKNFRVPVQRVPATLSVKKLLEEEVQISAFAPDQIARLQNTLDKRGYVIAKL